MSDVPPFPHSMLALQYSHFRGSINIVTIDVPQPGDDDCVIKVIAAGLCRSDWHGWLGHDPDISSFPHTPGHEFAGEVHAVGRYDIICMNLLTNSPLNRCGGGQVRATGEGGRSCDSSFRVRMRKVQPVLQRQCPSV
jgi:threonine dehydrogenase-like Zn-dependent dehydrogenase